MEEARVIRNQRERVLRRHVNTLARLLVEEDINGASVRLTSMKIIFEELEVAHYNYLEFLEMYDDVSSDDVNKCNDWFLDVSKSYLDEVSKARWMLKQHGVAAQTERAESDARGALENQDGSHGGLSEELATHLSLPKVEIPMFNGDPREYHMFISTFDQVVGNVLSSDQAKLTRLYQYLSGEARSAVKSFAQIGGGAGYAKARSVLKARFGSSQLVAQCVINDLRNGESATKPTELRALADEIASALQTLTQLGACGEVNTQQFICAIVMRYHPQVCSSWRRHALENHENRNMYPTFEQFATFMDKVAREACDPVYGFEAFKITSKQVSVNLVTESSSMKDEVVPSDISPKLRGDHCAVCLDYHDITQCDMFKAMLPVQRQQLARDKHLCNGCLSRSHMLAECRESVMCSINGCKSRHSKFLHVSGRQRTLNPSQRASEASVPANRTVVGNVNTCSVPSKRVTLPLITVLVNGHEQIALLDQGSTNTLVSKRLADKLMLKGESIKCSLNTVGMSKPIHTKYVKLNVASLVNDEMFDIDHVLVVPDIPAELPPGELPLSHYPYLDDVSFGPLAVGTKADLLIGNDNPDLLMPLDVRRSRCKVRQPYATLTRLGWVLQGPIEERMGDESSMQVNHVMMDQLSDRVDKLWDIERQAESVYSWFVKDKQVHDILVTETGVRVTETGPRFTETGSRVTETGVRVTETGVRVTETGVRVTETGPMVEGSCGLVVEDSCGLMVEDSCGLVVEDSCGLMVEDSCGLVVEDSCGLMVEDSCSLMVEDSCGLVVEDSWGLMVEDSCGLVVEDSCGLMVAHEDSWGLMVEMRCGWQR